MKEGGLHRVVLYCWTAFCVFWFIEISQATISTQREREEKRVGESANLL